MIVQEEEIERNDIPLVWQFLDACQRNIRREVATTTLSLEGYGFQCLV